MVRMRISICICVFMACLAVAKSGPSPSASPSLASLAPSVDCSTIIYDMTDCITFLSKGSTEDKPTPSCCSGFESVLNYNTECICEALKSSAELGVDVNLTKAAALPSACHVSAPPISECDVSSSPGTAPANPPSGGAPSPDSPEAPPVPVPGSSNSPEPSTAAEEVGKHAPAPALSGAYLLSASFSVLVIMLVIPFSYISV